MHLMSSPLPRHMALGAWSWGRLYLSAWLALQVWHCHLRHEACHSIIITHAAFVWRLVARLGPTSVVQPSYHLNSVCPATARYHSMHISCIWQAEAATSRPHHNCAHTWLHPHPGLLRVLGSWRASVSQCPCTSDMQARAWLEQQVLKSMTQNHARNYIYISLRQMLPKQSADVIGGHR